MGTGVFRRPFWPPPASQSALGTLSFTPGPSNASVAISEGDDTLSATATLDILASLAAAEADDGASSAGTVDIVASATIAEADDILASNDTLGIIANVTVMEADDVPSLAGAIEVTAAFFATDADDIFSAVAQLGIAAVLVVTEQDDGFEASALVPLYYLRRGGVDDREDYERWLKQWQESLRLIIDRSFKIAHGEIDPITFEPIPPPDYSPVVAAMIDQALSIDQARAEAFIAEQRRLQEDDAMAMLLLA